MVFDPISSSRFTGGELSGDVQDAINRKTVKRQMDDAPDLKWLAVRVCYLDAYGVSRPRTINGVNRPSRTHSPTGRFIYSDANRDA